MDYKSRAFARRIEERCEHILVGTRVPIGPCRTPRLTLKLSRLSIHNVCIAARAKDFDLPRDLVRGDEIITIQELNEITVRFGDAAIVSTAVESVSLANVPDAAFESMENSCFGAIARFVVDDYYFGALPRLVERALERQLDIRPVVMRNDRD
jgi:hypothetical protein